MNFLPEELIIHIINQDDNKLELFFKLYQVNSKYRNLIKDNVLNNRALELSTIIHNVCSNINWVRDIEFTGELNRVKRNYKLLLYIIYNNPKKTLLWRSNAYLMLFHTRGIILNNINFNILEVYILEEKLKRLSNNDNFVIKTVNMFRERFDYGETVLKYATEDEFRIAASILQANIRRLLLK